MDIDSCFSPSSSFTSLPRISLSPSQAPSSHVTMNDNSVSDISIDELCNWLKINGGIPEIYCEAFEGMVSLVYLNGL